MINVDLKRPTKLELEQDVHEVNEGKTSFEALGRKYNVSGNAVRKRMKKHGIVWTKKLKKGQYDYECFECEKKFKADFSRRKKSKHGICFCGKKCQYKRMSRGGHLSLNNKG